MSTTVARDLPVGYIPVMGFDVGENMGKYKDETEMERLRWAIEHRKSPDRVPVCQAEHAGSHRGVCTRPRGHSGMHFAGNGDSIVGAW